MTCIVNTKLGESKGQSRIWLEGVRLERGGFSPSTRYELVGGQNSWELGGVEMGFLRII